MNSGDAAPSRRLVSLDVFRGATIAGMILVNNPGDWGHVYSQLDHADWNGWTATDLIFPFFLFITGVSIVLSRSNSSQPKPTLYLKILKRSLILFLLGVFLNGFPFFNFGTIRTMGVLQRIAICYLLSSSIQLEFGIAGQAACAAACLLVYWALMALVPVPGIGAGSLEKGRNFAAYVDQIVLGRHMWSSTKTWDPEGVISTIPAISTTLFGALTGAWIRSPSTRLKKSAGMALAGAGGLLLGRLWSYFLPINKNLWTSSYSVFMAGFALVVLAACYHAIEERGWARWTPPFVAFGKNSIAVFMLSGILARILIYWKLPYHGGAKALKNILYQTCFTPYFSPMHASLAYALAFIFAMYLVVWVLDRRRIYIKI